MTAICCIVVLAECNIWHMFSRRWVQNLTTHKLRGASKATRPRVPSDHQKITYARKCIDLDASHLRRLLSIASPKARGATPNNTN